MKKFFSIFCTIALIACIPSAAWAKDLGVTRQHFLGKFIEGAIDIQSGHLITEDNYFQDPDDPSMHYIRISPFVIVCLQSDEKSDMLNNISALHIVPSTTEDSQAFITCIAEIAYATGGIPSPNVVNQYAFISNIGMAESSFQNGDTGKMVHNGVLYEWQVDYSYGGILFFVDPAY